jgi:5-(carboxyamino)imidazole ribonucleotide mutase
MTDSNKTQPSASEQPLVGVIMGSRSDWATMQHCADTLAELRVPHEVRIVSAHRTPDWLMEYAGSAEGRGLQVLIAAAGGAAHLPGMAASKTVLPVLGVPMDATVMKGMDALLSIVQMPGGVPVGTLAVGKPGAINAALMATSMLGEAHPELREALRKRRQAMTEKVLEDPDPRQPAKGA